ncbi:restriction nuclease [Bifidobacterium saguini DSM 23967]|uniref:Restriction nuclease n=1 Tax=Bifidobacterium saguini DSM 23967 TaxID=1437607 RepID=A0A087D6T8_9BIFI|nr:XamI family restriction endonuclease [Bifidobacterium saguini]KFI91238.1 restriction nuclease [Bifidobacterium saguini DSM 23967]
MLFNKPKKFTREELEEAASLAGDHFKRTRTEAESDIADYYNSVFDHAYDEIEHILASTNQLQDFESMAARLFGDGYLDTLRYMERPTLSADDFKKLSATNTDARSKLSQPENAALAMEYLLRNLNTRIFPWFDRGAAPTDSDLNAAKHAVAALVADQKTKTMLRNRQSHTQEEAVREALIRDAGFTMVKAHDFRMITQGPKPGEVFHKETSIDGVKADVVFGLYDGRIMALECKGSNTAVNSYKRLNHETVDKIVKWNNMFGSNGIVGGCVLQGVFAVDNLLSAQQAGVAIFWSASLQELTDYALNTKQ